jgi:hypothetical protein
MLLEHINPTRLDLIAPRTKHTRTKFLVPLQRYLGSQARGGLEDERVWTHLFTYGFVAPRVDVPRGLAALSAALTDGACAGRQPARAVLEMQPLSARCGRRGETETNSEIDLTVGDLARRPARGGQGMSASGIGFWPTSVPTWINLAEAKWLSDIAYRTTYDPGRNQLARVIETALTFQNQACTPSFPEQVFVTLLTPAYFKASRNRRKRHYASLFREYETDKSALLQDIGDALIDPRNQPGVFVRPKMVERVEALRLKWVTFEDLLAAMPGSPFKDDLEAFIKGEPSCLLQPSCPDRGGARDAVEAG